MISPLPITVLIAARNEERNIARCLCSLSPAERLIVLDSKSTDGTAEVASGLGAEVVQFNYTGGYPKKRQWALDTLTITTPWVLLLDADEAVSPALWNEMALAITRVDAADAYFITKGFHFLGRRFRFGGFSHKAVLLFRRGKARFERLIEESESGLDMEVHERIIVDGRLASLKAPLIHEDFKGLNAYIERHNKYATWEARVRYMFLYGAAGGNGGIRPNFLGNHQERRRFLKMIAMRVPFEPPLWFLYHYIVRLGFLEGRPGLIASRIRSWYVAQVGAKLQALRCKQGASD